VRHRDGSKYVHSILAKNLGHSADNRRYIELTDETPTLVDSDVGIWDPIVLDIVPCFETSVSGDGIAESSTYVLDELSPSFSVRALRQ
jgi:hypothetical protein